MLVCLSYTDKEPEARETGRVGFAQSHTAYQGGAGLGLVHWAQVPKLMYPPLLPYPLWMLGLKQMSPPALEEGGLSDRSRGGASVLLKALAA